MELDEPAHSEADVIQTEKGSSPNRPRRRRKLLRAAAALALSWVLFWYGLPWVFPVPPALKSRPESSLNITDRYGAALHTLPREDFHRHQWTPLREIPQAFREATLAAEDKRFYSHGGADFLALFRAVKDGLQERRVVSGASTITQQLVKISLPPRQRNVLAKVREFFTARKLEMMWSKDQILEEYLNRVDYGNLCIGVGTAAQWYFQKDVDQLSLGETALLAGLPQAPSRHNPLKNPDSARKRQHWVLERMAEVFGYEKTRIDSAEREPWRFRPVAEEKLAPHLVDWIAQRPRTDWRGEREARTTIDRSLQRDVEIIVRQEMERLRGRNVEHAAALVLDNATGDVLAWVGSADYEARRGGQINGALRPRSAGSTLKPFTYMLAMETAGYTPGTVIPDVPTEFRTDFGIDAPANYDRIFHGPVTVREALATSMNIPAMRTLSDAGGAKALADRLRLLGITTLNTDPAKYGLGLTIGNAEVTLLELTSAYACIARMGAYRPPRLLVEQRIPAAEQKLRGDVCFLIADILQDNVARFQAFGLASPLKLPFPAGVKTGTSTDFRDNWCVGFTPEFTVGVWVGNFSRTPMKAVTGVDGAGPIFHQVMLRAHRNKLPTWYAAPKGLSRVRQDIRTGKQVPESWPANAFLREDWIFTGGSTAPVLASQDDYDAKGRALLDERFRRWYDETTLPMKANVALAGLRLIPPMLPARIYEPAEGAKYQIDPDLPGGGRRLNLRSNLLRAGIWNSDTLLIHNDNDASWVELLPGRHTVSVRDPATQREHHVTFDVESL